MDKQEQILTEEERTWLTNVLKPIAKDYKIYGICRR